MRLTIEKIQHPIAEQANVSISMARADLIHPLASGNKIYKLAPNIEFAKANGYEELLSFGGAFSNHIHALALVANQQGFKSIGVIRGESDYAANPSLQDAQNAGMKLVFVTRKDYKRRNDVDYLAELQAQFPKALIIPEGGSSQLAVGGCAKLAQEINAIKKSDVLTVACGTGATFAGLVCGASKNQSVIGYSILRDESLVGRVDEFIKQEQSPSSTTYQIESADFGGYAKLDKSLLDFIFDWQDKTGILLDPIYTSKMCRCVMQQIEAGEFEGGTSICLIHSGGLQGWRGMEKRVRDLAGDVRWGQIEEGLDIAVQKWGGVLAPIF